MKAKLELLNNYSPEYLERIKGLYGFIYITTNIVNGKQYIGQRKFQYSWKTYLGSGEGIIRAIKKYGKDNFERQIIDIAHSLDELNFLENMYTIHFNCVNDSNWYNQCYGGGVNGLNQTNIVSKIVVQYTDKGVEIGRYKSSLEADRQTGICYKTILDCCKGKTLKTKGSYVWRYENDPFDKYPILQPRYKAVCQYTKSGKLVSIYPNTREAERKTGIDHSSIIRCCKMKHMYSGGFIWGYMSNDHIYNKNSVVQMTLKGKIINIYISMTVASKETNTCLTGISLCCNKKQDTSNGYRWKYLFKR